MMASMMASKESKLLGDSEDQHDSIHDGIQANKLPGNSEDQHDGIHDGIQGK